MKVVFLQNYDNEKDIVIGFHESYSGEPCGYDYIEIDDIPNIPDNTGTIYRDKTTGQYIFEQKKQKENIDDDIKQRIKDLEDAIAALLGGAGA